MNEIKEQWLILISTPAYLIIIGLELLLTHLQHRKTYTLKDTAANVYLMLLNSATRPWVQGYLPCRYSIIFMYGPGSPLKMFFLLAVIGSC
jgi:hypothetical protein